MPRGMGHTHSRASRREGFNVAKTTVADGTTKVYLGVDRLERFRVLALALGFTQGGRPNVSGAVKHVQDFFESHAEGQAATLAARAISEPKATREKIRAALTIADGNVSEAARTLDVSRGDFIRATEALDMGPEIAKRYPAKGAA